MDQSTEHLREISNTLYKYHLDNFLCDVFIVTPDGNEVPAHSVVLSAVSIKLRAAFEKSDNSVKKNYMFKLYVTDCDVPTVEIVLQFVYTGVINLPHEMPFDITRILSAGQKLGLDSTKLASCLSALLCLADSSVMENLPPVILTDEDLCLEIVEKGQVSPKVDGNYAEVGAQSRCELLSQITTAAEKVATCSSNHMPTVSSESQNHDVQWVIMDCKEKVDRFLKAENCYIKGMNVEPQTDCPEAVIHVCEMCGECFQRLSLLVDHQCEKHGIVRSLTCNYCGRAFVRLRALQEHERRHEQVKQYYCEACDKRFSTNSELTKHQRKKHIASEGPFHCNICNKDLANNRERAEHRSMHQNRIPCPECGKTFTLERSMRAHMISFHSDVKIPKPFECDICGHAFVRANLMIIHRRTHTGEKPFQCEICGRRFICRGDLNKHTRLHVDGYIYKCKVCGKEIKTSRESADHRRMHTSGINCPVCGKSFTRYLNMMDHVRGTHQGERRFKCDECGKSFVYPQNLRYHRRQHHNGSCKKSDSKLVNCDQSERSFNEEEEGVAEEKPKQNESLQYHLVSAIDQSLSDSGAQIPDAE